MLLVFLERQAQVGVESYEIVDVAGKGQSEMRWIRKLPQRDLKSVKQQGDDRGRGGMRVRYGII